MMSISIARAVCLMTLLTCGVFLAGCPCPNTVQVHNDTINPVTGVYVKLQVQNNYGDNLLSGDILPGETETIGNLTPGRYDVRLTYFVGDDRILELNVLCDDNYTLEASGD